jgi:hypothetical protein
MGRPKPSYFMGETVMPVVEELHCKKEAAEHPKTVNLECCNSIFVSPKQNACGDSSCRNINTTLYDGKV